MKTFCNICKKSFCESCEKDIYSHQEYLVNYTKMMSKEDAELMKLISEKFECQNKEIYKRRRNIMSETVKIWMKEFITI